MSEQLSIFERAKAASLPPDAFTAIWAQWPRKDKKEYSRECYRKACKKAYPEVIASAIASFLLKNQLTDKQFIPHLSTWLNQKRWVDETQPAEVQQDMRAKQLESWAYIIKKGWHTTTVGPYQARECLRAGLITEKEARDYGA